MTIDDAGNAFAAWTQWNDGLDTNGEALVVWQRNNDASNVIHANRYVFGTGWGTPAVIGEVSLSGLFGISNTQLSVSSTSNAAVVWSRNFENMGFPGDGPLSMGINHFTSDGGWGTASKIAIGNNGYLGETDSNDQITSASWVSANSNLSIWTVYYAGNSQTNISINTPAVESILPSTMVYTNPTLAVSAG
jgi:hypothetical protein